MTRLLEFIVALIIVFIIAVIIGVFLPSHAHIERSIQISHNPEHIYDVLNNYRRFPDYAGGWLKSQDPNVKFKLSGPAYGPGATISWTGTGTTVSDGKLINKSGTINIQDQSTVVWDLTNDWHGKNKTFTIQVEPSHGQRVSTVTWGYDVDYGWNLIGRYSQFWIHGDPAAMIQYGLDAMQNMLAGIPNVDYSKINPGLYTANATPVLLVSTKAPRTLDDIDNAKTAAVKQIHEAMAKLGVKAAGPTTTIATEYGDTTYIFDVAIPINTTTISVAGKSYDLTHLPPRPTAEQAEVNAASSSSAASAESAASAGSAGQPASGSSAGGAVANGPAPGSLNKLNQLIVNANVRALMMPKQEVLEATWTGEAGVPLMRLALQAYAGTHGYAYNPSEHRLYDQLASLPSVPDQDQIYRVFLPVHDAPAQTPGQAAGRTQPLTELDPSLWAGSSTEQPAAKQESDEKKPEARKKPEPKKKARGHHR